MKSLKKIKIGIPRTSIYNKNGVLLKNFFLYLGCKIILSNESNQEAENNLPTDICTYIKSYYKHIMNLTNECDYTVISNCCEYYQQCHKYNKFLNVINCHLSKSHLLVINPRKYEILEYLKIGLKVTKNPLKIIISYILAKEKQKRHNLNKRNCEKNKLNSSKLKVLLVANYNNIENNDVSKYIIKKLEENNIKVLLSSNTPNKEAFIHSSYFEYKNIEKEAKKLVGAIYYYRYSIRGMIYINTNNCTIDKYIINIIKNNIKEIPIAVVDTTEDKKNIDIIINILNKEIDKFK